MPDILILIGLGTFICYMAPDLYRKHGVQIVGEIPQGLPSIRVPQVTINFASLIVNSLVISLIATILTLSVIDTFRAAESKATSITETLALGISNTISSLFQAYFACASLSRSALLFTLNVKSPLANLISALIVVFTCLFLAPLIRELPVPILAAIIIFALHTILGQLFKLKALYVENKFEFAEFILAFLFVLILDIQFGIVGCIVVSLGFKYPYAI